MELQAYLNPLKKWWWLLLLATGLAAASSYLYADRQPPLYRTSTTLMVGQNAIESPNPNTGVFQVVQQLAEFYAQMAQRTPVREATMEALGLTWLPEYRAYVVPRTQFLEISVADTDPERAQVVANELARQLIHLGPAGSTEAGQRQEFIEEQLSELEAAIRDTRQAIDEKRAELAIALSARDIQRLQTEISVLEDKVTTLQANYAALLASTRQGAINVISVLDEAALPRRPRGSNPMTMVLLAAALGFSLSAAAAYVLEYLDDTLRQRTDVEKVLELPVLSILPSSKGDAQTDGAAPGTDEEPGVAESYHELRINLQSLMAERPLHTLLITSPDPTEGKTLAVARLGVALARVGQKVALLDTDLHRPQLDSIFQLPNDGGISTVLHEEKLRWHDVLYQTSVSGLAVMPSGPQLPNVADLLASPRMQEILADLKAHFDIVILDSPPVNAVTDALALATQVDGVLLVVSAGMTRRSLARRAVERLRQVHAPTLGVLLNRVPLRSIDYHLYGYSRQTTAPAVAEKTAMSSTG